MIKTYNSEKIKLNISEKDINKNYISNICKSIFGNKSVLDVKPLNKGYGHKCWKINIDNDYLLFKINIRHASLQEFNNEVFAQKLVGLYGIRVPDIVITGKLPHNKKCNFYIQRWIDGEDGISAVSKMTSHEYNQFFFEIGTIFAKLHGNQGEFFSEDIIGYKKYQTWEKRCRNRLNSSIKVLKNSNIVPHKILNIVETFINTKINNLSDNIVPSFLHGDLHLGNIIVNNGKFAGLIDFEGSRYGDKFHDFVKLENWVFDRYKGSRKMFMSGYKNVVDLEVDFEDRLFLYKGIEILYSINYFGIVYPDKKMLNSFIELLYKWIRKFDCIS